MSLIDLAILYGVVGVGCAVAAVAVRRPGDAALLLALWPLVGPFALARWTAERSPATSTGSPSPLGELLPDEQTMELLRRRLADGRRRIDEISAILARPEFRARPGLDNVRRLQALKKRFERELDEVGELLILLTAQAEVVRLVGAHDPATRELVRELAARVEGLDHMLAEEVEE